MNYAGEAADQIVKYSLDGIEKSLRLSGELAKHLTVFFAAVLKDNKKTAGRTRMIRMLKENRPLKFFTIPRDRLKEFAREGKKRGLLYVVIRDKKNPKHCELMVFADDAAKVNRVMDKMNLDFLRSESGEAVNEVLEEMAKVQQAGTAVKEIEGEVPEGGIRFELSDLDQDLSIRLDEVEMAEENFTHAQETDRKNPSGNSLRSNGSTAEPEKDIRKPSVRKELEEIRKEKERKKSEREKLTQTKRRSPRRKQKNRGKGR